MNTSQRDNLLSIRPAMGSCLTLTLVLIASLAPGFAAVASIDNDGGGPAVPLSIRRAVEPAVFGGIVLPPVTCAILPPPVAQPEYIAVGSVPATGSRPVARRTAVPPPPVRGP